MPKRGEVADRRIPKAGRESGYNVIELVLVVTVMGILMAAALPNFRNRSDRYRADAAAREMSSRLQWARQKSVATRVPRRLVLDTANMTYGFEYQTSDSTWEADPGAEEFTLQGMASFDAEIGGSLTDDDLLFETRGTIASDDAPATFQFVTNSADTAIVTIVRTGRVSTVIHPHAE